MILGAIAWRELVVERHKYPNRVSIFEIRTLDDRMQATQSTSLGHQRMGQQITLSLSPNCLFIWLDSPAVPRVPVVASATEIECLF